MPRFIRQRRVAARHLISGGVLVALVAAPLATAGQDEGSGSPRAVAAATGDALREGVRNGTTTRETEIIGRFNATAGPKGGYVTRQSNTQEGPNAGGGAVYGCRGAQGGTAGGSAPCLRATNLAAGYAFEFASQGDVVGLLSVGDPSVANPGARPFTTNATGVATGLNADRVDGLHASELAGAPGPQGAEGPQGPPGEKGDQGDVGPRGPSNGFAASEANTNDLLPAGEIVVSRSLPSGNYLAQAKVVVDNDVADYRDVVCRLRAGTTVLDTSHITLGPQLEDSQEVLTLLAAIPADPGDVQLNVHCDPFSPNLGDIEVRDASLIAQRIALLN